ncbi:MAG: LamG domain-containing protein [Verrucomicrobiota bacterium]
MKSSLRLTSVAGVAAVLTALLLPGNATAVLISHWALDGSGATAVDSVGSNDLTLNNSPTQNATGIIGDAYSFNGTNQFLSDYSSPVIPNTTPFSMGAWFNSSSLTGNGVILQSVDAGGSDVHDLIITSGLNNNMQLRSRQGAFPMVTSGDPSEVDGQWHHVMGVWSASNSRTLYLDGIEVGTNTTSVNPVTTRFGIGGNVRNDPATEDFFNGRIDDAGLWDNSLDGIDVALLHGLGRFSGVNLADSSIDAVRTVFENQIGSATAGSDEWFYATNLGSTTVGEIGGSIAGGNAFIVLDNLGNGVMIVPEPSRTMLVLIGLVSATCLRRSRRV